MNQGLITNKVSLIQFLIMIKPEKAENFPKFPLKKSENSQKTLKIFQRASRAG